MAQTIGSLDLNAFSDLYSDSNQYFWFESDSSATYGAGVHVTLVPDTSFISNPTGQNILMNTDGFSIRNGLLPMMTLDNDSLDFNIVNTTAGTYKTTATFTATSAQIGQIDGAHSVIDASGQRFYATDGTTQLANIGYGVGNAESGTATAPYYTLGTRELGSKAPSAYSSSSTYQLGALCKYNGEVYVCSSAITTPEAWNASHWQSLIGNYSTAEGEFVIASGGNSHAEGRYTAANGYYSHAEGGPQGSPIDGPVANGAASHAEGTGSRANGGQSHAEGGWTQANGNFSHSQNHNTVANGESQTVLGKYNVADTTNAVIIGNGTADNARSNALTVDWSGNVNIASGAKYKINGTNLSASDVSAIALSDKYTRSSTGDLAWTNQTDGDAKVIAKSALAFWNGAYNGSGSNLSKCSTGNIIGSNGGTMTGQLLTSYRSSVAMGSYGSSQTTVGGLVGEVRFSSGCAGSASINTAYTKDGVTIPTGWYNFMYMPHRSGGVNGSASGDNCNYGNLFLFGMNNTNGRFVIRVASSAVAEVVKIITTKEQQRGSIASTSVSANSYKDVSVTFSPSMASTPIVVCSLVSTSTAGAIGSISASAINVSTTGFTIRIFNAGSSAREPAVNWIAMV